MVSYDICYIIGVFFKIFLFLVVFVTHVQTKITKPQFFSQRTKLPTVTAVNADDPPPSLKKALYPADQFSNRS